MTACMHRKSVIVTNTGHWVQPGQFGQCRHRPAGAKPPQPSQRGTSTLPCAPLPCALHTCACGSHVVHTQPARCASMAVMGPVIPQPLLSDTRPRALSVQAPVFATPSLQPPAEHTASEEEPCSPTRKRPRCMTDMHTSVSLPNQPIRPASAGPMASMHNTILEVSALSSMLSMPMGIHVDAEGAPGPATPQSAAACGIVLPQHVAAFV